MNNTKEFFELDDQQFRVQAHSSQDRPVTSFQPKYNDNIKVLSKESAITFIHTFRNVVALRNILTTKELNLHDLKSFVTTVVNECNSEHDISVWMLTIYEEIHMELARRRTDNTEIANDLF